jgi:hypothetical protein
MLMGLPCDSSRLSYVKQAGCTGAPKCSGGRPTWLHAGGRSQPAGLQFSSRLPPSCPKTSVQGAEARDGAWVQVLLTAAGLSESGAMPLLRKVNPGVHRSAPWKRPQSSTRPHHPPMSKGCCCPSASAGLGRGGLGLQSPLAHQGERGHRRVAGRQPAQGGHAGAASAAPGGVGRRRFCAGSR